MKKNAGLVLTGLGLLGLAAAALFFQARWGLRSFAVTLAVLAIALGLLLNAALLLAFDLVAERRGAVYLTAIEGKAKKR